MDTSLAPMLGRLARALPAGDFLYEPKWDGFRCLVFKSGGEIDLRSRHGRPLARYFPEVVARLAGLPGNDLVLDGELVLTGSRFDFGDLLKRVHPASSRVERLSRETPAAFVAFDLLAEGGQDLCALPLRERRARLEELLAGVRGPLLTPATTDRRLAENWLERFTGGGVDGVVAKALADPYRPGKRAFLKVKREWTADCAVPGFRWLGELPAVGSLLLGLHDESGALRHVGVVTSLPARERSELAERLREWIVPLAGHAWARGFGIDGRPMGRLKGAAGSWTPELTQDWVPLRPGLVAEVAFDQVDGDRFRHPPRLVRWRPDRDSASCGFDQLPPPAPPALFD